MAPSSLSRTVAGVGLLALLSLCVTSAPLAQGAATLEVAPGGAAPAGSTVTVRWSGPNAPGDYITVVRKGAPAFEYLNYKPTSDGRTPVNPVSIVLPAEPGAYEIRYLFSNPRRVLAVVPYEVTAIAATIDGPASVAPGARFEVSWTGPNNGGDWVTIVAAGAAARAYGSYVDARIGNPDSRTGSRTAELRAPADPGRYELRYVQQGRVVIGTRTIEVAAGVAGGAAPGAPAAGGAAAGAARRGRRGSRSARRRRRSTRSIRRERRSRRSARRRRRSSGSTRRGRRSSRSARRRSCCSGSARCRRRSSRNARRRRRGSRSARRRNCCSGSAHCRRRSDRNVRRGRRGSRLVHLQCTTAHRHSIHSGGSGSPGSDAVSNVVGSALKDARCDELANCGWWWRTDGGSNRCDNRRDCCNGPRSRRLPRPAVPRLPGKLRGERGRLLGRRTRCDRLHARWTRHRHRRQSERHLLQGDRGLPRHAHVDGRDDVPERNPDHAGQVVEGDDRREGCDRAIPHRAQRLPRVSGVLR